MVAPRAIALIRHPTGVAQVDLLRYRDEFFAHGDIALLLARYDDAIFTVVKGRVATIGFHNGTGEMLVLKVFLGFHLFAPPLS